MAHGDDTLSGLREAVRLAPDDVALRQQLGERLLAAGRVAEAEAEFRRALARSPRDERIKTGLAEAFFGQGKLTEALVVLEDALRGPDASGRALVLYARLLLLRGDAERAARLYQQAIAADPVVADHGLARRLGLGPELPPLPPAADLPFLPAPRPGRQRPRSVPPPVVPAPTAAVPEVERPALTFADVGGLEALKDEIRIKLVHPLTHPDLYAAYGKTVGGGVLLYGPPGCGKTHLARAAAGESKACLLGVGIDQVLDMWVGRSERNLHAIFAAARAARPCVLFFDEVDALAANRSELRGSGQRQVINQFLAELDGGTCNQGVLVLAATNAPWHLDPAFRRPGRFDRVLFVPPPDEAARAVVLRLHCRGKPVDAPDYALLARQTDGYSGADLKAIVDLAIERKLSQALRDRVSRPLTTRDLLDAAGVVRPSTREWFATARNYALYANQAGTYDEVLKYLRL